MIDEEEISAEFNRKERPFKDDKINSKEWRLRENMVMNFQHDQDMFTLYLQQ